MKLHFRKNIFRIAVLSLLFVIVFLAIASLWKLMDIPKTPDPSIWKGFPKDEVWRKFFSISIPLVYGLFTLAYIILSKLIPSSKKEDIAELYCFRRYDFLTYSLIPIFLLMMLLWRYLWDWYLFFGIFYLSVVFIKTTMLSKVIYRWIGFLDKENNFPQSPNNPPIPPLLKGGKGGLRKKGAGRDFIRWGLFLTGFLLYASVSLWINYSIPPAGDEPHYLMITHSLLYDRDFDLKNNIEQEDHRRFSWVYFPMHSLMEKDGRLYSIAYSILCFLLIPGYALGSLIPDYALGGRLGALLTINLMAAWLLLELFLFTLEISKSHKAAFISWAIAGFTSPVFFFSSQVYPEIAGAFVLLFTLRRLLNRDFKLKGRLIIIAVIALIFLKERFISIALTLPMLWAFLSNRKKGLRMLKTGIGIIGPIIIILGGMLIHKKFSDIEWILQHLIPERDILSALAGLFFDQEFGLLFYSPLYAFGLIGIPWFLSRYRKEGLVIILPVLIYIFVIINFAGAHWFGGWALPSRLIVVITPLIGLIAGIMLSERRGLITAFLTRSLWIWSISIVFIMSLVTLWRYNSANGANILLGQTEELFSTRITRLFPSFVSPTPEGSIVFAGLLVFFIIASILILRQKPSSISSDLDSSSVINPPSPPFSKGGMGGLRSFAGGLLLLLLTGGLIIVLGRTLPTRQIEGENMRHTSGIQFRNAEMNVWVLRERGILWDYVVLPDRRDVYARILAAGQCNTGESPHIVVRIEDKMIGEMDIPFASDSWQDFDYVFKIPPMKKGMHLFSIELTNGINDTRDGIFCGLYVDRVEFRRNQQ